MMMDEGTTRHQSSSGLEFKLHPLVLINVSDHHTRTKANTGGQDVKVLGCLLGIQSGRTVDITNSFEIKHDRTAAGIEINAAFLVKKQEQYKQVFPKLDVVGWYTTGQDLEEADKAVNRKIMEINESPVVMLLNPRVDHTRKDLPITLFESELRVVDGNPSQVFVKAHYTVETSDAERIGVDQVAKILPSGKASGSEQLTAHLIGMHSAIKMLNSRVRLIQQLLQKMQSGEVPFNHALVRKMSSLVHSLPAMDSPQFSKDYLTEFNDTMLTIYLSSMTKGVSMVNDIVEKYNVAYEKTGRRRGAV
mmetsp:Transcript_16050/g.34706  ORF Transcript_16050/g.34706 Transcript_16050/m.34706 type:complete len:305 (-) Transcript_16050:43-957(-)